MCCILCEEPVRSITFGLAAVGIVTLINGSRKLAGKLRSRSDAAETNAAALFAESSGATPAGVRANLDDAQ